VNLDKSGSCVKLLSAKSISSTSGFNLANLVSALAKIFAVSLASFSKSFADSLAYLANRFASSLADLSIIYLSDIIFFYTKSLKSK
jgi:hypothetical protein